MPYQNMQENFLDDIDIRLLHELQQDASRSNQVLAACVGVSPATALRRVRRLTELGIIARQVALLQPERLAKALGHGLNAFIEVSLERQHQEALDAFEKRVVAHAAVQQCWRVSPGPDFVLVVAVPDMPGYQALAQQLFNQDANVRHVRAFFSIKCAKFVPAQPLPPASGSGV